MQTQLISFVLWVCVVLGMGGCAPAPPSIPDTQAPVQAAGFVPGDMFVVEVYDEDNLSGEFQIQEDGSIDFPLVGRVEFAGLTQASAARVLEQRLAEGYLKNPQVKIVVTARQNFEISVLGQVAAPGTFPWVDRLTLVQAISDAGGVAPLAARKHVRLTRKTADGGHQTYEVSLKAITEGSAQDPMLQPGDIVFVPEVKI